MDCSSLWHTCCTRAAASASCPDAAGWFWTFWCCWQTLSFYWSVYSVLLRRHNSRNSDITISAPVVFASLWLPWLQNSPQQKCWTATNAESSLVQLCVLDRAKARDTLGDLNVCYHVAFEDNGCRSNNCLLSKSIFTRFLLWYLTAALCQPAMCHPVLKRSESCPKISTPFHDWKWHTTREASLLIYI